MRLIAGLLLILSAAACERLTDATSPCFGPNGAPAVSRAASTPRVLPTAHEPPGDCRFEPLGQSR